MCVLAALAVLVFIGLWERHAQEATALGFSGIYERYLAFQAGFSNDPTAYREATAAFCCTGCSMRTGSRSLRVTTSAGGPFAGVAALY